MRHFWGFPVLVCGNFFPCGKLFLGTRLTGGSRLCVLVWVARGWLRWSFKCWCYNWLQAMRYLRPLGLASVVGQGIWGSVWVNDEVAMREKLVVTGCLGNYILEQSWLILDRSWCRMIMPHYRLRDLRNILIPSAKIRTEKAKPPRNTERSC
jgi:hypothetical protein